MADLEGRSRPEITKRHQKRPGVERGRRYAPVPPIRLSSGASLSRLDEPSALVLQNMYYNSLKHTPVYQMSTFATTRAIIWNKGVTNDAHSEGQDVG